MNKRKILEELKAMLDNIQVAGYDIFSMDEEDLKLVELHDTIAKEEIFWRQRSRNTLLKEGDGNTKYFYMTTMKHKMTNEISKLKVNEAFTKEEDFKREAIGFFSDLL